MPLLFSRVLQQKSPSHESMGVFRSHQLPGWVARRLGSGPKRSLFPGKGDLAGGRAMAFSGVEPPSGDGLLEDAMLTRNPAGKRGSPKSWKSWDRPIHLVIPGFLNHQQYDTTNVLRFPSTQKPHSVKLTAKAPENQWLEDVKFPFGARPFFSRGYVSFRAITSRFVVFWNHQIEMDLLQQSCAHQACILYCTLPQNLDNPGKSMVGRCTVTSYWNRGHSLIFGV